MASKRTGRYWNIYVSDKLSGKIPGNGIHPYLDESGNLRHEAKELIICLYEAQAFSADRAVIFTLPSRYEVSMLHTLDLFMRTTRYFLGRPVDYFYLNMEHPVIRDAVYRFRENGPERTTTQHVELL